MERYRNELTFTDKNDSTRFRRQRAGFFKRCTANTVIIGYFYFINPTASFILFYPMKRVTPIRFRHYNEPHACE